jgi:hypothetical protein
MCSYSCGATLWLALFICDIHAASVPGFMLARYVLLEGTPLLRCSISPDLFFP